MSGSASFSSLLRQLVGGGSYKHVFWMRTCYFSKEGRLLKFTLYPIARIIYRHLTFKLGISIPWYSKIGSGFYIGHFGGIIVSGESIIGKNCNISQGVTIGKSNRGKRKGFPVIGDNVYIGPGAKIIGSVRVGSNAAIGANCVVVSDVPDNSVVVGVPGRVVSHDGSVGYITYTDYDEVIA